MTLNDLDLNIRARITQVNGEGDFRRRLLDMGLTKGQIIVVKQEAPLGDPIEIRIRGYELSIRRKEATQIEVAPCQ